jgi:hypothetical protein
MPRTIDLIRASKLPSNMMQFAAKGALSVPPEEAIEILVYLAKHNKVFGDLARMTLAGWDEKASLAAASDPKTPREVLDYLVAPDNLRPKLLPALLENPSVPDAQLAKVAISATPEAIAVMLQSSRVRASAEVLKSLRSNPYLKGEQSSAVVNLLNASGAPAPSSAEAKAVSSSGPVVDKAIAPQSVGLIGEAASDAAEDGNVPDEAVTTYLAENAADIATAGDKPFQPVGGIIELLGPDLDGPEDKAATETVASTEKVAEKVAAESGGAAAAAAVRAKPAAGVVVPPAHRDNAVQKINRLDIKGRIQLALKGNKEERSLLIRDGTKVVALAVLEAPKLSDGEVEKFALQKNVLEAVLRQIPLKRRFMKNYIVVRNLVANPRTPLDLGLGLMKHLQTQDLKNISANKEVSETVRKLASKMYKQKLDSANKK